MDSDVTCRHVNEVGCEFYFEGRLCPQACPGYERKEGLVPPEPKASRVRPESK